MNFLAQENVRIIPGKTLAANGFVIWFQRIQKKINDGNAHERLTINKMEVKRNDRLQSGQLEFMLRVLHGNYSMEKQIFAPWWGRNMLEGKIKIEESRKIRIHNGIPLSKNVASQYARTNSGKLDLEFIMDDRKLRKNGLEIEDSFSWLKIFGRLDQLKEKGYFLTMSPKSNHQTGIKWEITEKFMTIVFYGMEPGDRFSEKRNIVIWTDKNDIIRETNVYVSEILEKIVMETNLNNSSEAVKGFTGLERQYAVTITFKVIESCHFYHNMSKMRKSWTEVKGQNIYTFGENRRVSAYQPKNESSNKLDSYQLGLSDSNMSQIVMESFSGR